MVIDERILRLRHTLHRNAALSNEEAGTAAIIRDFLADYEPDELIEGVGGHGLLAVWRAPTAGPVVLLRAELDGLPIPETLALEYGSKTAGVAHKCGHDGHMAMVAGLAPRLAGGQFGRGTVVLMFQAAEETGEGARRMLDDPRFADYRPDWAFALHNLPGVPLGHVVLREGCFASASKGLMVELEGATAHAAEPHMGRSPALATAFLIQGFSALPQLTTRLDEAGQVTVIHANLGSRAFGTSPGSARVAATLRTHQSDTMERLEKRCLELVNSAAEGFALSTEVSWHEEFPPTHNDPEAVEFVRRAALACRRPIETPSRPFAWSEDFGCVTGDYRGVLFGLGAGVGHPALHHPEYDFPDELLPVGIGLFDEVLRNAVQGEARGKTR